MSAEVLPQPVQSSASTSHPAIRSMAVEEIEEGIIPVVRAFADDPIVRWFYPEVETYERYGRRLVTAFAGHAFEHGTAFGVEGYAAGALWLPPGVSIDEGAMEALIAESIPPEELERRGGFFEQQIAVHPHEPHWYLPMIGVDPSRQGEGLGSALLEYSLQLVDRDRAFAYLEATSLRSKALYERFGFTVVGLIQAGDSPPMWPMVRVARR